MCLKRQGEAFGLEQISLGYRPLSFNSKYTHTNTQEREREKKKETERFKDRKIERK